MLQIDAICPLEAASRYVQALSEDNEDLPESDYLLMDLLAHATMMRHDLREAANKLDLTLRTPEILTQKTLTKIDIKTFAEHLRLAYE